MNAADAAARRHKHGSTRLEVKARPALYPSYRSSIPDYVVRCRSGRPVRFTFAMPAGREVSFDGAPARGGRFGRTVDLDPGHAVRFTVSRGRTYHVRCLPHDFPGWKAHRNGIPEARWYILTPNDNRRVPRYVALFDSYGVPVWWMRSNRTPFNASLLPDGNLVWTELAIHNPSTNYFEERGFDGRLVRTYRTVGADTNEHELQMLPDGNVLLARYPARDGVDLSRWGGPKRATVLDGEVQEIDPLGRLVWSWRTTGHIKAAETGRRWFREIIGNGNPIRVHHHRRAYDIVHLNSIAQVGNRIVISARHLDAVYEIDKTTGQIVWKLGGTHTSKSLRIVGDHRGWKEFGGQHDARVFDGGRYLTIYENGAHRNRPPRALEFRIHAGARTARLVREISWRPAQDSICCGSARVMPGGDWVMAWGHTPWITEQTASGRPVFTLQFTNSLFMSYRAVPVLPGRLSRSKLRRGMDAMLTP
ncbi:MAG: hypothetical protein E6G07_02610 [Actinobacteria bacterium]|nr:MAG: hypothetical protein E6G07_02610 [Actinomycetota bacterium]